jgi:hypothetical protein
MKQIFLPYHLKKEILNLKWDVNGERRKVSVPTLWAALNYTTKTKLADALRAAAMQRGGVIYDSNRKADKYIPICSSHIDRETGVWTFVFSGRVVLTWHEINKTVEIFSPDKPDLVLDNVRTIDELVSAQFIAEKMAAELDKQN